LLGVVILFAGFAYGRRKRVAELKTLVRSVEERAAPSAQQIDQLSQAIIRSQKSFKGADRLLGRRGIRHFS
jgi:hypothetical protein